MNKNIALKRLVMTALAVMIITLMIPASVFAATKTRRTKTIKTYNSDGELTSQTSYTYDSKGNTKKEVNKNREFDHVDDKYKWIKSTTTYTRTYYSNGNIKKAVSKYSTSGSYTSYYNSNGVLTKTVDKYKTDGKMITIVTTYKYRSNGKIKSSVTKRNQILKSKSTFDSNGRVKKRKEYDDKGKKVIRTTTYSYKTSNGRIIQETEKTSDGSKYVFNYKYNQKGDEILWAYTITREDYDGTPYTESLKETYKYKYNKDGSIKEKLTYDQEGELSSRSVYTYTKKKY